MFLTLTLRDPSFLLGFLLYEGMRVERAAGPVSEVELTKRHKCIEYFSFDLKQQKIVR